MDQQLSCYRPSVRNRKWYFPIFVFLQQVAVFNSWTLYRQRAPSPLCFLDFIRSITRTYITNYATERVVAKKVNSLFQGKVANRVKDAIRRDGVGHIIDIAAKKSRCALCSQTTKKFCTKCKVKLHDYCFAAFHGVVQSSRQ